MDVKFYEVFDQEEQELKKHLPPEVTASFTWKTIQAEGDTEPPAEVICIRTQSVIPSEWATKLRGILSRSQGFDHLTAYRNQTQSHVACGYLQPYCSRAVAEQAVLSMMMLLRKVKKQVRQFDEFKRDGLTGIECEEKNALVVGVGQIGSEIVNITKGLGMNVHGVDIIRKSSTVEYIELAEGIPWADVIFSAVPLTDQTQGMLNYAALSKAKKGVVVINISRGEVTPLEDMNTLFIDGILGGLALDVFEHESELAEHLRNKEINTNNLIQTLKGRDDVLFTPHNAFNTEEALKEKSRLTVKAITEFLQKGEFPLPIPNQ